MPSFSQARAFWYQWMMYIDAGVEAIGRDPIGFAHPVGYLEPARLVRRPGIRLDSACVH